jgi:hypothetical protein
MGTTTELRRALKTTFFTEAIARGFAVDQRLQPVSTIFRRRVGGVVQIFELQWDKYGRPRFAVHFGTCSTEGLRVGEQLFSPDETLPTWCADVGTLEPRGRKHGWFRQDAAWWQRVLGRPALRDPAHVVEELQTAFRELESYWENGAVGRRIRRWPRDDSRER